MSKPNTMDAQFKHPLVRRWCHKDEPPKGYREISRLDELDKYNGYYERVEE